MIRSRRRVGRRANPGPRSWRRKDTDVEVGLARTCGAYQDEREAIREIEALFVDMIGRARGRFVYAENQYFASRAIACAIAARLAEPDGPEFVLVNPHKACEGWLEEAAIGRRPAPGWDAASGRGRPARTLPHLHPGDRGRRGASTSTPRS